MQRYCAIAAKESRLGVVLSQDLRVHMVLRMGPEYHRCLIMRSCFYILHTSRINLSCPCLEIDDLGVQMAIKFERQVCQVIHLELHAYRYDYM